MNNYSSKLLGVKAEKARRSYYEFLKLFFPLTGAGRPFVDNWHVNFLCDDLQRRMELLFMAMPVEDFVANVPPGSLKSTIYGKLPFAWACLHAPNFAHMGLSYSESLAKRDSRACKNIILSDLYQSLFNTDTMVRNRGQLRTLPITGLEYDPGETWREGWKIELSSDQREKANFETTTMAKRYAAGLGGTITGEHVWLITIDDPHNPKQASSEAQRTGANDVLDETLPSRFKSKTSNCTGIVMQRLHENDMSGHALAKDPERKRWFHICIPAELDDQVAPAELAANYVNGLFFPDEFPQVFLDAQKGASGMGPTKYAGQYQQTPIAAGGTVIKGYYFQFYDPDELPSTYVVDFYADTAFGKKSLQRKHEKNVTDWSVILAHTTIRGKLHLLDLTRDRLKSPAWRRRLVEWTSKCGYGHGYTKESTIRIEPKANGQVQIDEINEGILVDGELVYLNVVAAHLPRGDDGAELGKVARVENIALPKLETYQVLLPLGNTPMRITQPDGSKLDVMVAPWVPAFITECMKFPNGTHDDQVDVLEGAIRWGFTGPSVFEMMNRNK